MQQLNDAEQITVERCVFELCSSISHGGAIQVFSTSKDTGIITISESYFDTCSAEIHGGAIYLVISRSYITKSCFRKCTAKSKVAVSVYSISDYPSCFNQSIILSCGRAQQDDTTCSGTSTVCVVSHNNYTKNMVSGSYAGQYIQANANGFMHFCQYFENAGGSIVNFFFRTSNSSLKKNNFVNNSAQLQWKHVVYCNNGTTFGWFVFIRNPPPFIASEPRMELVLYECVFDEEDASDLFNGITKPMNCHFNEPKISISTFETYRKEQCANRFNIEHLSETSSHSRLYLALAIIVIAVGCIYYLTRSKSTVHRAERQRLLR